MNKEEKKLDDKNKKEYRCCCFGRIAVSEEYINGKKTGKGKMYYVGYGGFSMGLDGIKGGKLIYEGSILNNEKNGKGKEYSEIDEALIYEGEFLDDKRNGKGKEYGKTIFEGEFQKGKKWNGIGYDEKGAIVVEIKEGNGKIKDKGCYWEKLGKLKLKVEGEYIKGEIK